MKFHLGEIAVIAGPEGREGSKYNGTECEIIVCGTAPWHRVTEPVWGGVVPICKFPHDYEIRLCDGLHACVEEHQLRKKRPPIPDEVLTIFEDRVVAA